MLEIKKSNNETQVWVEDTAIVDKLTELVKKELLVDVPLSREDFAIEVGGVFDTIVNDEETFVVPALLWEIADNIVSLADNNPSLNDILSELALFYSFSLADILIPCLVLDANFGKVVNYLELNYLEVVDAELDIFDLPEYEVSLQKSLKELSEAVISNL